MARILKLALVLSLSCALLDAQRVFAQDSDVLGNQILERAIATAGGRQAWKETKDFKASGTLALYSAGSAVESGKAELLGIGLKSFQLTAALDKGTRTWGWKDGNGIFVLGGREGDTIGRHNVSVLEGLTLPVKKVIALLDSPSRSIQLMEPISIDGTTVYRVRILRIAASRKEEFALGRPSLITDILVDQKTFLILGIQDTIHPNDNLRSTFPHKVIYGNYRLFAGIQVPFSVKEEIAGQLMWTLQLDKFETNLGLVDSQFMVK